MKTMIPPTLACLLIASVGWSQAPAIPSPTADPTSGYDHGFFLRSADGQHELRMAGLLQVQGRFFEAGLPDRVSDFYLRRMRLEFVGTLHQNFRFKFEPNFNENGVQLNEAWIGLQDPGSDLRIILGRMKEPFSLEELSSLRRLDFVEKSLLGQFVPAEDHGITIFDKAFDQTLEWGLAYYNGSGGNDLNSDKDVAGRVVLHPGADFQFGVAATHGRARQDIGGKPIRTETRVPIAEFSKGAMLDGPMTRLGAESAWFRGPFSMKAEYMHIEQDMNGSGSGSISFDGFYVACTYLLTGERKSWRSVEPRTPYDPRTGSGTGAWELAARFSQLELDDDLVSLGLIPANTHAGRVRSIDIGLNWYMTTHARAMLHGVHTDYRNSITRSGNRRNSEDALMLQFQLSF